jgi:hypothetical protein
MSSVVLAGVLRGRVSLSLAMDPQRDLVPPRGLRRRPHAGSVRGAQAAHELRLHGVAQQLLHGPLHVAPEVAAPHVRRAVGLQQPRPLLLVQHEVEPKVLEAVHLQFTPQLRASGGLRCTCRPRCRIHGNTHQPFEAPAF